MLCKIYIFLCMLSKIYILSCMLYKIYEFTCMLTEIYICACMLWNIYIFPCMLCKIYIIIYALAWCTKSKSICSLACCAKSIYSNLFHCMLCKIYIFPCMLCEFYIFYFPLHVVRNLYRYSHAVVNLVILYRLVCTITLEFHFVLLKSMIQPF